MAGINVSLKDGATELETYIIDYTQEKHICDGIGKLTIRFSPNVPNLNIGDSLVLKESGNLIGTYYVGSFSKEPGAGYFADCQDASKWLQDYFIPTQHNTGFQSSKYWIGWVLDQAQLSYNFTTSDNGYVMAEFDKIGLDNAYGIIVRLCQQSGWYFYFDSSNVCQIGELQGSWVNPSTSIKTSEGNIIDERIVSDDDMLRNRVIVWGSTTDIFGNDYPVYASVETTTPWDRDLTDKRTIVYTNSYIKNYGTAWSIAKRLLDEYSKTVSIKTYTLVGYTGINPGDIIYCNTTVFNGNGRVTSVFSDVSSSDGYTTTLVVDERCPRMFAYWSLGDRGDYVYIGTRGSGVKRKDLEGSTWYNYSSGLGNLNIKELKIKNGLKVCTTDDYRAYVSTSEVTYWVSLAPIGFTSGEDSYDLVDLITAGCGINELTGEFYVGYTYPEDQKSWVVGFTTNYEYTIYPVINDTGNNTYIINDVDTNNKDVFVTAKAGLSYQTPYIHDSHVGSSTYVPGQGENTSILPLVASGLDITLESDRLTSQPYNICWDDAGGNVLMSNDAMSYVGLWNVETDTFVNETPAGSFPTIRDAMAITTSGVMCAYSASLDPDVHKLIEYDFNTNTQTTLLTRSTGEASNCFRHFIPYVKENGDACGVIAYPEEKSYITGYGDHVHNVYVVIYNFTQDTSTNITIPIPRTGNESTIGYVHLSRYRPIVEGKYLYLDGNAGLYSYGLNIDDQVVCRGLAFLIDLEAETGKLLTFPFTGIHKHISTYSLNMSTLDRGTKSFNTLYWLEYFDQYLNDYVEYVYLYRVSYGFGGASSIIKMIERNNDATDGSPQWEQDCWEDSENAYYNFINNDANTLVTMSSSGQIIGSSSFSDNYHDTFDVSKRKSSDTLMRRALYHNYAAGKIQDLGGSDYLQSDVLATGSNPTNNSGFSFINENILAYNDETYEFVYFMPNPSGETYAYPVILQMKQNITVSGETLDYEYFFDEVASPHNVLNIDTSVEDPVIFFGGDSETNIGEVVLGRYQTENDYYYTANTLVGVIPNTSTLKPVMDARTITSPISSTDPEYTDYGYARHIVITQPAGAGGTANLLSGPASIAFSNWTQSVIGEAQTVITFSGNIQKVESTRYETSPYIFVAISGAPSEFWQQHPGDESFTDYSTGLPISEITVIRVDDRL